MRVSRSSSVYHNILTQTGRYVQQHLSCRQCRWQEFLTQYDYNLVCVQGEDNCVTDALSCLLDDPNLDHCLPPSTDSALLAAVFSIDSDNSILENVLTGYHEDPFCVKLLRNFSSIPGLTVNNHLLPSCYLLSTADGNMFRRTRNM